MVSGATPATLVSSQALANPVKSTFNALTRQSVSPNVPQAAGSQVNLN
jgi:hypothetical protein